MIESWGRGIERILAACAAADLPAPEIRYERTGLWVNYPFYPAIDKETPVKTPVKTPDLILELLGNNPNMTLAEVSAIIGKSTSATERAAAKLVKAGHLQFIGPRRAGYWKVLKK